MTNKLEQLGIVRPAHAQLIFGQINSLFKHTNVY
jgi:hypothetical protein